MLTLDSTCPIAWRHPSQASGSNVTLACTASPTRASSKHQRNLSNLIDVESGISDSPTSPTPCSIDADQQWLSRRYNETLYLGEEHSPLVGFLRHLRRFEKRKRGDSGIGSIAEVTEKMRELLRSRQAIRKRFASTSSILLEKESAASVADVIEALSKDGEESADVIAREIIQLAIESGPGALVGNELKKEKSGIGKMTKLWLQAIECREIQIQILLVLYLLQLSTKQSSITTVVDTSAIARMNSGDSSVNNQPDRDARSILHSDHSTKIEEVTTPPAVTKRKRKAEVARRWTGSKGIAAFPWTLQRQTSKDATSGVNEEDDCSSAESLSKRFEALLDSLCLQMLTNSLGIDDKKDTSPTSAEKTHNRIRERLQPWQLFGSEGRRRGQMKEDKDVLQWLCCSIIEPNFSKSLPRQCGIVRGKCFVPGSGTTPAKPSREKIDSKKLQKPQQGRQRSSSKLEISKDIDRSRRSMPRGKSPSPMPWSLLKEVEEKRSSRQSTPSLLDKLDARTVTVRKSWSRSQSIGPISMSQAMPPAEEQRSHSSFDKIRSGRSDTSRQPRPSEIKRESQTLVMATPSKGAACRSSSFSSQSIKPRLSIPTVRSDTMAAWRRTESQPVLSGVMQKERGGLSVNNEEGDDAAEEQIVDSLFYDDSEDEENHSMEQSSHPATLRFVSKGSSTTTKRPSYDDNDDADAEAIIVKKRRTLPSNFSFALQEASNTINTSRNPFAVSSGI